MKLMVLLIAFGFFSTIKACTIFSGKDKHGNIWTGNNEDYPFSFVNYINVFPRSGNAKYGYYTLSYFTKENGENFNIQGGMNEAGLFYDLNTIPSVLIKDLHKKKNFPEGSQRILSYILESMETVDQVVAFFEKYWFEVGFNSAQMHVADKYGNFAIVGPSGNRILRNQPYQISTNFDVCGVGDSGTCWRFPIVEKALKESEIGLNAFTEICKKTSIKGKDDIHTIYSNIQNLNTGEIWFYFSSDYENHYKTSLKELLGKGRKSYLIRDLFPEHPVTTLYNDLIDNGGKSSFEKFESMKLSADRKKEILSIFVNYFLGSEYNMEALPFLEEYLRYEPIGYWMRATRAIYYHQLGQQKKAESIVNAYKNEVPDTSMDVPQLLELFQGVYPSETNVTIELHGHQEAKHVFVKGLPIPFNFLIKKDGKWMGKYNLEEGIYNYSFIVDGKETFDHKTPIHNISSIFHAPFKSHRLFVNLSTDAYLTKINTTVPNKDDVVYIAGNQQALAHWNSVFRMEKISDFEREITLPLHFPALFKFTRGNWETEAIIKDNTKEKNGRWVPLKIDLDSKVQTYEILGWKDQQKKNDN